MSTAHRTASAPPRPDAAAGDGARRPRDRDREDGLPKVAIPVIVGVLAGVLFLASNVAALHDPRPHGAPVAVAGAPAPPLQRALDEQMPGGYDVRPVGSATAALHARDAYVAVDAEHNQVLGAGANGFSASMAMQQALVRAAPSAGLDKPSVRDAVPLQSGDPRGLSLPQVVLGTIIGGFMMGVLTAQLALGEPLWQRLVAYLAFAIVFGFGAALVLDPLIGALTGHFLEIWLWVGVTTIAIAVSVGALARILGQAGVPVAVACFLVVGNPSSGASSPTEFLPVFFRTVGPFLPPNALAQALLGTTYFDADLLRPVLVLGTWILVPAAVLVVLDRSRGSRRALAHDAAAAAAQRADRDS